LALLAFVIVTPTAGAAGPPPQSPPPSCGYTAFEQPFTNWGDFDNYVLAPNGSFEWGTAGWTLTGGAGLVSPGSPIMPGSGGYSLSLPAGSSATTPPICVDGGSPYSRMFAYTTLRNFKYRQTLRVELIYTDNSGKVATRLVDLLADEPYWDATPQMSLPKPVNIKATSAGNLTVRYRFTPLYKTAWRIDDLYVDPKKH
jgi:hypothetical protein